MDIDFEKIFSRSLIALRINGAHPSVPRNKKWLLRFTVMHGIFTVVFLILVYNIRLSLRLNDFSEACRYSSFSVIYCVISFKYVILVVKQNTISRIIEMMKADFAKDMPEDARAIVLMYAKRGRTGTLLWVMLVITTMSVFIIKHTVLELYTYVTEGWKILEFYPMTYPSPVEENKKHPVVFVLLYLAMLYYMFYAGLMYLGFVPLGPAFMLHACGQLEIVKKRTLALYVDNSTREAEVKLNEIVKHLQYIYGFVELTNKTFKLLYEITLRATVIILPITVYEVLGSLKRGEFNIELITIIIGAVLISSGPCYYSDMLMDKSEEVRLAIYSCGWETRYDRDVRKTLLITLLRTMQPMAIRTMFRALCLDTLADVYHQAFALLNLMNAAWG